MASYLSRERTPTSPSPSPEPAEGEKNGAEGVGSLYQHVTPGNIGSGGILSNSAILPNTSRLGANTVDEVKASDQTTAKPDELARQVLEEKLRIGIDDLFQLAMCAGDVQPGDEDIVRMKVNETMESLQAIQDACNAPELTQMVPEDVMGMIDQGRNPDIHTRTFTNRLNGDNQQMRGQAINFDRYRSRLRAKIESAFPEMKEELQSLDSY